jgi:hypothetical protein
MKKFVVTFSNVRIVQTLACAVIGIGLALCLWVATVPQATGRDMGPAEMLASKLPPGKTLANASKPELLSAVCAAAKRFSKDVPQIVRAAVGARKNLAADIVAAAIRCQSEGTPDCGAVGDIVAAAISGARGAASAISDAAVSTAPDCADAIQAGVQRASAGGGGERGNGGEGTSAADGSSAGQAGEGEGNFSPNGPSNLNPPPGSAGGGGGGAPPANLVVCDNGTETTVAANRLGRFLRDHPGARVGACQPTPRTNR